MRSLRTLLVVVVLLLGVFFVADLVLARVLENRIAAQVSTELGAPATVDLRGWPITLGLLSGEIAEIGVRATGVPVEGSPARITTLTATLPEVPVDVSYLTRRPRQLPLGRPGRFVADVSESDLNELADLGGLQVQLVPGRARLSLPEFPLSVEAEARVEGQRVVIRPASRLPGLNARYVVDPPQLPGGAMLQRVEILPGVLRLSGSMSAVPLQAAES